MKSGKKSCQVLNNEHTYTYTELYIAQIHYQPADGIFHLLCLHHERTSVSFIPHFSS
jgi:hypothetical protein